MASVNKTSVRGELDRLKTEFQRQSDDDALSNENRLLIQGLFALLELIIAIFLEKNTQKQIRTPANHPRKPTRMNPL